MDLSLENSFISLNNGRPTRIKLVDGALQQSSPDITFVSSDIAVDCKWKTTNETLGSDHLIIKIQVLVSKPKRNFIKKRNFKKASRSLYKDILNENFTYSVVDPNNIQVGYDFLVNQINYAADKSIPLVKLLLYK